MQTVFDNLGDGVSAVRQGLSLGVQQSSPPRAAWLHAGQNPAGRFSLEADPSYDQPAANTGRPKRSTSTPRSREVAARMRKPGGNRYERRAYGGRYIEYIFRELEDGGLLGVYHDITDIARTRGRARRRQGDLRRRARRGRSREPGEIDLPRHHEPRNPHADERRARHDGGAGASGPGQGAAQQRRDHARLRRRRCCASSTTCSTSPRSRPAAWNWRTPRSRCPA